MKQTEQKRALHAAIQAAQAAGEVMRRNFHQTKKINSATRHDIKLELDVRCQRLIERGLATAFPRVPVLGEEGETGDMQAPLRWVVDPIDGTVNFTYGIPHACVAIALQEAAHGEKAKRQRGAVTPDGYSTVLGVVYDPFVGELWTALRGGKARLNGRVISASRRSRLGEAIVSIGFAKREDTLNQMLPLVNELAHRVRKLRIMGSAALAMTYVASGRTDAYMEAGVRLWDIAAGGLIVECAGGDFYHEPVANEYHTYRLLVNNGRLRRKLSAMIKR